jgi:hypothetical protein
MAELEIAIADLAFDPDTTVEQLKQLEEKLREIRAFIVRAIKRNTRLSAGLL